MPALTKKKPGRKKKKPFTGLTDRYGQPNLQLGKENAYAIEVHKYMKAPSRKRKGSMTKKKIKSILNT